jgi:hypothetical protein
VDGAFALRATSEATKPKIQRSATPLTFAFANDRLKVQDVLRVVRG